MGESASHEVGVQGFAEIVRRWCTVRDGQTIPCRQFLSNIIGRVKQSRLCQTATKECQLSQADGTSFVRNPTGDFSKLNGEGETTAYVSSVEIGLYVA